MGGGIGGLALFGASRTSDVAATAVSLLPGLVIVVGLVAYTAVKGGFRTVANILVPVIVDLALILLLPYWLALPAIILLIPVIGFGRTFLTLRGVVRSTMEVTDWPMLAEAAQPVLAEFASYGFVPAAATSWDLTTPPVIHLLVVNPAAATYADISWHQKTGVVLFTVVSDLPGGGKLLTSRLGKARSRPTELRQVFPDHVASQLVWFHLSALEYLASRGIHPLPATFERALPRWIEAFEADKARVQLDGVAMAWGMAWRQLFHQTLDKGPLWGHPDIESKLTAYAGATHAGATRADVSVDREGSRAPWTAPPASTPRSPWDGPGSPAR
jgi:hypothetical protein